jgi:hypothetical protein
MRSPTPQCPVNGEPAVTGRPEMRAVAVSGRAVCPPSVGPSERSRAGNAAEVGRLSPVTVPLWVKPRHL